jgi:hypothetical protein
MQFYLILVSPCMFIITSKNYTNTCTVYFLYRCFSSKFILYFTAARLVWWFLLLSPFTRMFKYMGCSCSALHTLLNHMDALALCSFCVMLWYLWVSFACWAFIYLILFSTCMFIITSKNYTNTCINIACVGIIFTNAILYLVFSFMAVIIETAELVTWKFVWRWTTNGLYIFILCGTLLAIMNVVTVQNFDMYGKFNILCTCTGVNHTLKWIN